MNKKATAVVLALSQATFAGQVTSTGDNRVSVAVTVYNDGRGLVREERNIDLTAGVNEVRFMDVAEQIQAPTVRVGPHRRRALQCHRAELRVRPALAREDARQVRAVRPSPSSSRR